MWTWTVIGVLVASADDQIPAAAVTTCRVAASTVPSKSSAKSVFAGGVNAAAGVLGVSTDAVSAACPVGATGPNVSPVGVSTVSGVSDGAATCPRGGAGGAAADTTWGSPRVATSTTSAAVRARPARRRRVNGWSGVRGCGRSASGIAVPVEVLVPFHRPIPAELEG